MSEFKVEVLSRKAPRPRKRNRKREEERFAAAGENRSFMQGVVPLLWWLLKPRRPLWVLGALAFVVVVYGTPHMLVTHNCYSVGTPGQRCSECRYFGVQGMRGYLGPNWDCPVIVMLPVNWSALLGNA
ncbi:MAG: hypothetical protein K9G33_02295 [Sneathiella sp.]|nr:hypothetical protein [Sneathiella sp.]